FSARHAPPPDLHSCPTRRSSDLDSWPRSRRALGEREKGSAGDFPKRLDPKSLEFRGVLELSRKMGNVWDGGGFGGIHWIHGEKEIEEHTSELQSLRHLVCRLLLE